MYILEIWVEAIACVRARFDRLVIPNTIVVKLLKMKNVKIWNDSICSSGPVSEEYSIFQIKPICRRPFDRRRGVNPTWQPRSCCETRRWMLTLRFLNNQRKRISHRRNTQYSNDNTTLFYVFAVHDRRKIRLSFRVVQRSFLRVFFAFNPKLS